MSWKQAIPTNRTESNVKHGVSITAQLLLTHASVNPFTGRKCQTLHLFEIYTLGPGEDIYKVNKLPLAI